jgi:hypothetical protein
MYRQNYSVIVNRKTNEIQGRSLVSKLLATGSIPGHNSHLNPVEIVPPGRIDRRTDMNMLIFAFRNYAKASETMFRFPSLCLRPRVEVIKCFLLFHRAF